MTSVVVWEHDNLKTASTERSEEITLVSRKIQLPHGNEIRSLSSRQTGSLVSCLDGSVHYCTNDVEHPAAEQILTKLAPVKNLQNLQVIQAAAGDSHNVIVTNDHRVHTWGKNYCGQLGREGSRKNKGRPKLVKSLASYNVLQVSCGSDHTLALSDDGLVFAWGSNSFGQVGLGKTTTHQTLPEVISSLQGLPVRLVAAGSHHSFLLTKSGSVYGWGRNDCGQLGLNSRENSSTPKECSFFNDKMVKYICCGESHSACLTKDGSVFTFGAGSQGQLGHCTNSDELTPKQVTQLSGCEVTQIACGSNHTLAYESKTGRLHIFGFGGSGHFSVMEEENENCHITLSGHFVQTSENQSSTLCLPDDNQNQQHRIKTIYAGGNNSFLAVMAAKQACEADDFRNEDSSRQILTLSQQMNNILYSLSPDDTPPSEIGKIFSSASCLNSSFLLPNDEHYGSGDERHGVDLNAVRQFFQELKDKPKIMKCIHYAVQKNLIPQLPSSPLSGEAIRLYLMLPECDLFDKPEFYHSLICQFAKSFLDLDKKARKMFTSWYTCSQASFFKRLVVIFKQCSQYLLQLPYLPSSREDVERNKDLVTCLDVLKVLHKVNQIKNIISNDTFIVPELKDKVDVQKEYIHLRRSQPPKMSTQVFKDSLKQLVPVLNTGCIEEERVLNDFYLQQLLLPVSKQDLNFCSYPFLFDGEMKSLLFQTDAKLQMLTAQVLDHLVLTFQPQLFHDGINFFCKLNVDRENIVDDTLSKLCITDTAYLKKPFWVQFNGENAAGGGVLKEFFKILFCKVQEPAHCFFKADDESTLMWFDTSTQKEATQLRLIGILCGLVIYNSVAIDFHFPLAMYKKLLKRPVSLDDLKELSPVIGKSMQEMLDYDEDNLEDVYNQTFEFASIALCPGGSDRAVTQSNKKVFVGLSVDHILNKSVQLQFDAFSEGFYSVCGDKILNIFEPEELRSMVEGNEDYDFSELEKNTIYANDYCTTSPTIKLFWEVFHEMSLAEKKKFLLFLTSSDRIPVTGMKNISIAIQPREEEDGTLPFAYTCTRILCLPRYTLKKQMQDNLLSAIQQTEGFRFYPEEHPE